jgi:hypothetical protein
MPKRWWNDGVSQRLVDESEAAPPGFSLGRLPESDETKARKSASLKGLKKSDAHRAKIAKSLSGKSSGMLGKRQSEEAKRRQSDAKLGRKNPMFGTHRTAEQRKLQSERVSGERNGRWRNEDAASRAKATTMSRYGCCHAPTSWYAYGGASFDSFPELCFYLYHSLRGKDVKREPMTFSYEFDGKALSYTPDFELDGQLYEIKGDQFLREDGTWFCPYQDDFGRYEAKRQCALKSGVKILYAKDYQRYIDWFKCSGLKKEDFRRK